LGHSRRDRRAAGGEAEVPLIIVPVLALLGMAGSEPSSAVSTTNHWAEPTRGILAQHCGQCHLPDLPTSAPRALAVFNLNEEPWHGRLTHAQFDSRLRRLHSIQELPESDMSIVESFVRCARDRDCPPVGP